MLEISDLDQAQLKKMGESFMYFLQKYEGYALTIATVLHSEKGVLKNNVRIDLSRIQKPEKESSEK